MLKLQTFQELVLLQAHTFPAAEEGPGSASQAEMITAWEPGVTLVEVRFHVHVYNHNHSSCLRNFVTFFIYTRV